MECSDNTPVIVVLHGLTGGAFRSRGSSYQLMQLAGSYESYVRSILSPACAPIDKGGLAYRAVVVNFRGCMSLSSSPLSQVLSNYHPGAGVPITSPQLYSAGYTDDIRQALLFITKLYPHAPLLGLGFSLGANIMTRYIAEEGEQSRLAAACVLACVSSVKTKRNRAN